MEKIKSFQEYKAFMKKMKNKDADLFSNIYFWPADLMTYIDQERLYYEENEAGIVFFLDEENHYKVYMSIDVQKPFVIAPKEKKLLIRNIYKEKPANWKHVEDNLIKNGFFKSDSVLQVQADLQAMMAKGKKVEKYLPIFHKKGYRIVAGDWEMYQAFLKLAIESQIIEDHHFEYRTEDELAKDLADGACICIVNQAGEVCAGSYAIIQGGGAEGVAVVVAEPYKMEGFAPILAYERAKWLEKKGIESFFGWIRTDNDASLKYHYSIGYRPTGKYVDEWILNK